MAEEHKAAAMLRTQFDYANNLTKATASFENDAERSAAYKEFRDEDREQLEAHNIEDAA